ncbi:uncharacterized protein LOC109123874 [Vitis vinifera]|uniref:uncharacterized protein LOC109123874 n=1 Tax=Vitis vinifera TaxID=29760 RepID=UPI0008FEB2F1|nr:uncharacterized protein LOC109123874 [Vitis vinifera]|eukprot:XP_019080461.1 PREDICTED: uncharacterized protein LOC109123874 [Vitis vinifera]
MERRKSRVSLDPLATVKAAAWAWYQRGSGSEGKPISEFQVTRARPAPIPSRYKLEAMRMAEEGPEKEGSSASSATSTPNLSHTSLLDTYEIERISQQLDILIETSGKGIRTGTNLYKGSGTNSRKEKKKLKGFWARHAIVCGTEDDVLETIRVSGGDRKSRWQ